MIKSGSSNIRKFQFLEAIKESESNSQEKEESKKSSNEKSQSTISLNNINISGPRQMHTIDNLIFINGKVTHKKEGVMVRENLIMKISDNEIIDEFRIFNIVYYDFLIKKFEDKNYFIVVGSNVNENMFNNKKEIFMMTSIKIYDATSFIKEKNKIAYEPGIEKGAEPYPKFLIKQIKLLKRISDGNLISDNEGQKMEGYESIHNINSFSMNDNLTHAAISIDRGGIILIYGYQNFLECKVKKSKNDVFTKNNVW